MENINPYTDLVVRYFENDLNADEKQQFEHDLQSNTALKSEYDNQKKMNALLGDKEFHSFYDKLNEVEEEVDLEEKKRKQRMILWYASAASVVLILSFSFLLPIFRNKPTGEVLFAENYEMAPSIIANRSVPEELLPIEKALLAYDDKNFTKAVELFESFIQTEPTSITAQYFLGLSYIETEKLEEASVILKAIAEPANNVYSDQAEWYLALSYLKLERMEEAKQQLESMASKEHYQKENADKILKQMD